MLATDAVVRAHAAENPDGAVGLGGRHPVAGDARIGDRLPGWLRFRGRLAAAAASPPPVSRDDVTMKTPPTTNSSAAAAAPSAIRIFLRSLRLRFESRRPGIGRRLARRWPFEAGLADRSGVREHVRGPAAARNLSIRPPGSKPLRADRSGRTAPTAAALACPRLFRLTGGLTEGHRVRRAARCAAARTAVRDRIPPPMPYRSAGSSTTPSRSPRTGRLGFPAGAGRARAST